MTPAAGHAAEPHIDAFPSPPLPATGAPPQTPAGQLIAVDSPRQPPRPRGETKPRPPRPRPRHRRHKRHPRRSADRSRQSSPTPKTQRQSQTEAPQTPALPQAAQTTPPPISRPQPTVLANPQDPAAKPNRGSPRPRPYRRRRGRHPRRSADRGRQSSPTPGPRGCEAKPGLRARPRLRGVRPVFRCVGVPTVISPPVRGLTPSPAATPDPAPARRRPLGHRVAGFAGDVPAGAPSTATDGSSAPGSRGGALVAGRGGEGKASIRGSAAWAAGPYSVRVPASVTRLWRRP